MSHLKVAVRVRPLSQRDINVEAIPIVGIENGRTITITNIKVPEQNAGDSRERIRRFTFDYCFQSDSSQQEIFETVETAVQNAIKKRYHSCVLAYGQSCSGKTHTMMGQPGDPGIIPKLCENMFRYLEEVACGDESLETSVSYLEIYNEKVRDLLNVRNDKKSFGLRVREHPKDGPYVQGLTVHSASDTSTLLELLETGTNNRRVAATLTNPKSSRSHSVFTIGFLKGVKLHLIDLAGSERAGSRCPSASRFKEGANINKSLVALGNVISALADQTIKYKNHRRRFVPYRDSVLTWLLKDTLGGNSKTFMIATISPSNTCYSETVNTLRFGQRAKQIVTQPVVNEDPKERTIRELRAEICRLKELICKTQTGAVNSLCLCNNFPNGPKSAENNLNSNSQIADTKLCNLEKDISDLNYLLSKDIEYSTENIDKKKDLEKLDSLSTTESLVSEEEEIIELEKDTEDNNSKETVLNNKDKEVESEQTNTENCVLLNNINANVSSSSQVSKKQDRCNSKTFNDNEKENSNESISLKHVQNNIKHEESKENLNNNFAKPLKSDQEITVVNSFVPKEDSLQKNSAQETEIEKVVLPSKLKEIALNQIKETSRKNLANHKITTEVLIPLMDVRSDIIKDKKATAPLRRTFSVVGKEMERSNSKFFGSQEVLANKQPPPVRKKSIESTNTTSTVKSPPVKENVKKNSIEGNKEAIPEIKKVEAKVDSIRKTPIKPRAEIVAAVTQRLYNKIKRREVATETEDIIKDAVDRTKPMFMSPATRLRLREITARALRAHRRKTEETQTDFQPIIRVKETGTETSDLKLKLLQTKDADTNTCAVEMVDASVDCIFLDTFDKEASQKLVVTRSCGTQYVDEQADNCVSAQNPTPNVVNNSGNNNNGISFTKYLSSKPLDTKIVGCSNPIYTASVNINVSHNYLNRKGNVSQDSLEEHSQANLCFPTPDLISNHNSLEQQTSCDKDDDKDKEKALKEIKYATTKVLTENFSSTQHLKCDNNESCFANLTYVPNYKESVKSIKNPSSAFAPQICIAKDFRDKSTKALATVLEEKLKIVDGKKRVLKKEPILLKSIMRKKHKHQKSTDDDDDESSSSSSSCDTVLIESDSDADSLDYHKRVRFSSKDSSNEQMFHVMSKFLKEATTLMNNLTKVASNIEKSKSKKNDEQTYEFQVTVNDVAASSTSNSTIKPQRQKHIRKQKRNHVSCQTRHNYSESCSQTSPKKSTDAWTDFDDNEEDIDKKYHNKYDDIVKESCDTLEQRINAILCKDKPLNRIGASDEHTTSRSLDDHTNVNRDSNDDDDDENDNLNKLSGERFSRIPEERFNSSSSIRVPDERLNRFPQPFTVSSDWFNVPQLNITAEDSSLDSNMTFSDNPTFSDYGSLPRRRNYRSRPSRSPSAYLRQLTNLRQQIIENSREEMHSPSKFHI